MKVTLTTFLKIETLILVLQSQAASGIDFL